MTQRGLTRQPETRPAKALVVDDEPVILEYLAEVLEEMGFEVCSAHDVQSALRITSGNGSLDVAFVDLALPDRSGLELIAELNRTHPGLPIVMATTYAAMAVADLSGRPQGNMVLGKPYDQKSIADVLRKLNLQTSH